MEKQDVIKLGKCNRTKAFSQIERMIANNVPFVLKFMKKDDDCFHVIEHTCYPAEYKTDENGKKWRRVYEDQDDSTE